MTIIIITIAHLILLAVAVYLFMKINYWKNNKKFNYITRKFK